MRSLGTRVIVAAWLLVSLACSKPPVQGRYYQGLTWIDFKSGGKVLHGGLGDTAQFQTDSQDPQKLVIFDPAAGQTAGRIINATTVEFPAGDSPLMQAFGGRWVAQETTTAAPATDSDKATDAAAIAGIWRIPGETDVLEFRPDFTYQWGPRLKGTYTMMGRQRVRRTVVQDGNPAGYLEERFTIVGDEMHLAAPDGVVTKYERVK